MIKFYNRISKDYEIEQVAGESYLKWCYESPIGKGLTELLVKRKLFSKLYGSYCDSKLSKKKVNKFIDEFNIDMSKVQKSKDEFTCFNDFFYRKLTPQGRPIDMAESTLISPGDGRLLAFEDIKMDDLVQVKDITYSLSELIGDDAIAKEYNGGVCLILRLCPTDYHRFHFIDSGIPTETKKIKGNYYSVNPIALEKIPKLFCQNKREWCTFKSDNFGDVICIEVGATCVGGIIQSYSPNTKVSKGDEKGYFKFGGSTTVLFFKKDTIKIDDDIMEQSKKGLECKVQLGEKIGEKIQ